jgi:hypothetical protein
VGARRQLTLIEMTRVHLVKEAYYRKTGEWLGEEVSHQRQPKPSRADRRSLGR